MNILEEGAQYLFYVNKIKMMRGRRREWVEVGRGRGYGGGEVYYKHINKGVIIQTSSIGK